MWKGIKMTCCDKCIFKQIGLIATDRNVESGKLVYSMLEQCPVCKTIRLSNNF